MKLEDLDKVLTIQSKSKMIKLTAEAINSGDIQTAIDYLNSKGRTDIVERLKEIVLAELEIDLKDLESQLLAL